MIFGNLYVETFVCLSCGQYFNDEKITSGKVGDLKLPKSIKDNGKFFKMFACPHCNSVYVGFIPSKKQNVDCGTRSYVVTDKGELNNEDAFVYPSEKFGPTKLGNEEKAAINKNDDFSNFKREKKSEGKGKSNKKKTTSEKPQRQARKIIKCTSCKSDIEVSPNHAGTFGTKCKKCLDKLIGGGH